MARTAMTGNSQNGKGKRAISKTSKKPKKPSPRKERKSFSIKKPLILQSTPTKKKRTKQNIVIKEIKYYQQATGPLLSKSPFIRMVREIVNELAKTSDSTTMRFTAQSLEVLQEVFEAHITALMEASYYCTRHAKRVTLYPVDIKLVSKIKGISNV